MPYHSIKLRENAITFYDIVTLYTIALNCDTLEIKHEGIIIKQFNDEAIVICNFDNSKTKNPVSAWTSCSKNKTSCLTYVNFITEGVAFLINLKTGIPKPVF